ncbi:MAG: dihydrofolate reductase [Planctomycetes bacterium]|nr:dihydrofolate reductase [Planctomycetota bacterium]
MNAAGCIGRRGTLPWHHPEDLAFFKRTTLGGTIVMGRRTWDGLPRKPLPGRTNVVLTRRAAGVGDGAVASDLAGLDRALAETPGPVFVIGGAEIYAALLDRISTFLVTRVDDVIADCDTYFPTALGDAFDLVETTPLSPACRVERWERRG